MSTPVVDDALISVIVPCRNEAAHIDAFCASVVAQQLPPGLQLEVLVADGLSDDGTRERLQSWCERDARFALIDNPGRIVSCGLNRCIERARGVFLVRLDVHTVYAPDYLAQCWATWQRTGADNVGGPWRAEGGKGPQAVVQRAIAAAFQSRWVSGGALSRSLEHEGPVDTVYLGAWPRQTFERFGGFDEQLVRNQDDEHNLRIKRQGGRIWQSARIRSSYQPRATVAEVYRQYRQYGYWKPFVMKKHGQPAAWRHLLPGAFVAVLGLLAMSVLVLSGVASLWPHAEWTAGVQAAAAVVSALLCLQMLLYGLTVLGISKQIAREQGEDLFPYLPRIIAAYHFSYGLGFLQGWRDAWWRGRPDPAFGRLTRGPASSGHSHESS